MTVTAIPVGSANAPDEIDALSAKARRQAVKLNRTLDALQKLGVTASVCHVIGVLGGSPVPRVRLTLVDPAHKSECQK